jgi:hypothetical protein
VLRVFVSQLVLIEAPAHVTQARPPRLLEGKKDDGDGMKSGGAGELSFSPSLGFAPGSLLSDLYIFNPVFIA